MTEYKMTEYKYKNPLENGYKKIKVSNDIHNKVFKFKQMNLSRKLFKSYTWYISDKRVKVEELDNWFAIVINTIFFPWSLLMVGLSNFNELKLEFKRMYNQRKYGAFYEEVIWESSTAYELVKNNCKEV
jgi:hypothetical protein